MVVSVAKELHISEDHTFWIKFQFAGFLHPPPSTYKK